jgi:phosphate transporter
VGETPPFNQESKDHLNEGITQLVTFYTKCVTHGDGELAKQQLKLHQRENIAWERDTVWRQMIGRQRRGEDDGSGGILAAGGTLIKETEEGELVADIQTPVGKLTLTKHNIYLLVALSVFIVLLNVQTMSTVEASRCFAILVFCTILWATEVSWTMSVIMAFAYLLCFQAIPLFVTSLLVPLLLVCLGVMRNDKKERMDTPDAAK